MFSTANRPPFGGTSSSSGFGFGTPAQNPFGTNQMFNTAQQSTSFGAATPAFGQAAQPMFGATPQSTSLFGSTATPTFGSSNQNAFGSTPLFGQAQQQPQQQSTSLFGSTTNTFGQQNKSTGFGFGTQTSLFGQPSQAVQPTSNMFPASGANNLFNNASFGTGTPIKFNPVTSTDSMQKGGNSTVINTKLWSITCMKEYEGKSYEELRYEDYLANRKGPQAQTPFGTTQQSFAVASTAPPLFRSDNTTGFGNTTAFAFGNQASTSQSAFKPNTGFGSTITTAPTLSFSMSKPTFGTPQASATSTMFSQPTPSTSLGTNNIFNTASTSLQFKPQQPAFPTTQNAFSFSNPQSSTTTTQANLFQTAKPNTGFTGFAQSSLTSFAKPAPTGFSLNTQPQTGFGTGLGTQNTGLFQTANKTTFAPFKPPDNTFSHLSGQQPNMLMPMQQQQPQMMLPSTGLAEVEQLRLMLSRTDKYGYAPHLSGLKPTTSSSGPVLSPKDFESLSKMTNRMDAPLVKKKMKTYPVPVVDHKTKSVYEQMFNEEPFVTRQDNQLDRGARKLRIKGPVPDATPLIFFDNKGNVHGDGNGGDATQCCIPPPEFQKSPPETKTNESVTEGRKSSVSKQDANMGTDDLITEAPKVNNATIANSSPIDTCGINCTRPGYYTIPPLDKIGAYKNPDGSCFIKGFTVGRVGYGNVFFPDVMDVSNLNIDQIVHFRHREIQVYCSDDEVDPTKPPVGEGLNRRAQVTLDQCYPLKEGKDNEYEEDPKVIAEGYFVDALKESNMRSGAQFKDYRPETGSWVFNVSHFSIYGLSKATESELKLLIQKRRENKETETENTNWGLGGTSRTEESSRHASRDHSLTMSKTQVFDSFSAIPDRVPSTPMLQHQELQQTFYVPDTVKDVSTMKLTFYETETTETADQIDMMEFKEDALQDLKLVEESMPKAIPRSQRVAGQQFTILNPSLCVPLQHSLVPQRNVMDAAMFKGRSFKVGWARGYVITALASSLDREMQNHDQSCVVLLNAAPQLPKDAYDGDRFADAIESFMDIVASETSFLPAVNNFGQGSVAPSANILHSSTMLHNILNRFEGLVNRSTEDTELLYNLHVWKLCNTFWGDCDENVYSTRRNLFSKWLEDVTSSVMLGNIGAIEIRNTTGKVLRKIFALLTGHQVQSAVNCAIQNDMPQLAMKLAQLPALYKVRMCAQHQLQLWDDCGSIDLIENELLKLNMLIAGIPVIRNANVCEGIDWMRSLAIHFWYIVDAQEPIAHAVQIYEQAFSKYVYAEPPTPIVGFDAQAPDLLYQIMKLFCFPNSQIDEMLAPGTHARDPTDYKMSWLLLQTFRSLDVGLVSDRAYRHICVMFSTQLESLGLYKWAIFVLMFIPEAQLRKHLILGILDRNVADDNSEKGTEEQLVKNFYIPAEWIHQVKAIKTNQLQDYWQAYAHLGYSQLWQECHELIFKELMPPLVANHQFDTLQLIFEECMARGNTIYRWKHKGGLVMDFINLYNRLQNEEEIVSKKDVKRCYRELTQLLPRLKVFPSKQYTEVMVISEISKFLSVFYHSLLQHDDRQDYVDDSSQFMQQLTMPFDYIYSDMQKSVVTTA